VRAVADTNVYISALNFGGLAEGVLALARQLGVSTSGIAKALARAERS
jgi:predicted nucleic acid-binding protein